jgi:hypothetical protein
VERRLGHWERPAMFRYFLGRKYNQAFIKFHQTQDTPLPHLSSVIFPYEK